MSSKRVLITGGAGFFGSRAALHFPDADVHLVDRVSHDWARVNGLGVKATRHEADLLDEKSVRALCEKIRPDVVVHLAWYAVPGKYLHADENFAHVHAATSLFLAAKDAGCTRFCGAGTCFEYDTSHTGERILSENSPTKPASIYAAAKLSTYLLLSRAAEKYGVSFAWLRFFFPYGPFEAEGRLVSATLAELLAGRAAKTTPGGQIRDFMHVDDIGRAVANVAESNLTGVVNIATGVSITVRDLVSELARAVGRPDLLELGAMPYRENDPMHVEARIEKLKSIGFTAKFTHETGLRDTVAWARARLAKGAA